MAEADDFKYDVAFSFLAQDETIAQQLNDLIQAHMCTFIYSERQKELAGKDGEEVFGRVFGREARFIAIFYRNGWGETPWTRVEKVAIQNRTLEEGHDFILCIPLDKPPTAPKWLPKNRIWIGLDRWGMEGAAAIIEARVQELGGTPVEESVGDRAARLARARQRAKEREAFASTEKGSQAAQRESKALYAEIDKHVKEIAAATGMPLKAETVRGEFILWGMGPALVFYWQGLYANTIREAVFTAEFCNRIPPHLSAIPRAEHHALQKVRLTYELVAPDRERWIFKENGQREFDTQELAGFLTKRYLDLAEKHKPEY